MAIWAKHTTKCRICGKKVAKNRLLCLGDSGYYSFSTWFKERCNIRGSDTGSDHVRKIQDALYYSDREWQKWWDASYQEVVNERHQNAVAMLKDRFNIDINNCPPVRGENSICLIQVRNWVKEQRHINYEVTSGLTSTELLIVIDEYLMSH